ncbi:MAG: helix-turn-helix transcriptional regulator, partial [Porticoccus sp.]|nr:helix-turn-helix transcriptional regulator [Porticoccus sp.]
EISTTSTFREHSMTPGNRLRRARTLNDFSKRTDFYQYLANNHYFEMEYSRLGRLERDEDDPTVEEVAVLCSALNMTADWYLMGAFPTKASLTQRIESLTLPQVEQVYLFIDAIRFR